MTTYTITPSAGSNGAVSPAVVTTVASGANLTVVAYPEVGYGVDTWTVDEALAQTGGGYFTFSDIVANHVIEVAFAEAVAPVSGFQASIWVAELGTVPTSTTGALNLGTDFTVTGANAIIKGLPTYGSSSTGVIVPSIYASGEETTELNLKTYFDPDGLATNLLLASYFATTAAAKKFNITINIGPNFSIIGQGLIVSPTITAKADGSIAEMSISKIQLFNAAFNTNYEIASLPANGIVLQ